MDDLGQMLTEDEVADYLKVSNDALKLWRRENRGPKWVHIESLVRYPSVWLQEYIERTPTQPQA